MTASYEAISNVQRTCAEPRLLALSQQDPWESQRSAHTFRARRNPWTNDSVDNGRLL